MLKINSAINTYAPIDCSFHDQLLELATYKKSVEIVYTNTKNEPVSVAAILKDIYTSKSKEEFLVLNSGQEIRLDKIIRAGKYIRPEFNSCDTTNKLG